MRHGSLFSGIGGFDLAAHWVGWKNVFQCEKDSFCKAVLKKHFPTTIRYEAIEQTDFTQWRGLIDVVSGGPPCQGASKAGKRRGSKDGRWLWPQYIRALSEISPRWSVAENVRNLLNMGIDQIFDDLDRIGYITQPFIIPASAVGALHNRDRIWLVSLKKDAYDTYADRIGLHREEMYKHWANGGGTELRNQQICLPGQMVSEGVRNGVDPRIFRTTDGISHRMDRIRSVGNAICPHLALEIFKTIEIVEGVIK